jgi:hypothetical protein
MMSWQFSLLGWLKGRIALPATLAVLLPENILAGFMPTVKLINYLR